MKDPPYSPPAIMISEATTTSTTAKTLISSQKTADGILGGFVVEDS
jgi:hypothetical protein